MTRHTPTYEGRQTMPFGRYAGRKLADVPLPYLAALWALRPLDDARLQNYIANRRPEIEQAIGEPL